MGKKEASSSSALLIPCILLLVAGQSYGLKCYVCNSAYDDGCDSNPIPERFLVECNSNTAKPVFQGIVGDTRNFSILLERETIDDDDTGNGLNFITCRKDDATIPDQYHSEGQWREGSRRIFRSCGWLGKSQNRCKRISVEPIQLIECSCATDNCNSGNKLETVNALLGFALHYILFNRMERY